MMRSGLLAVLILVLAPAGATAGGFATVGLESPPPQGSAAGERWVAEFTVLTHGRTPADGLRPAVLVEQADGGAVERFPAIASGRPGGYHAHVVFPDEGRYRVLIDDGYSQRHSFSPVSVGRGEGTSGDAPPLTRWLALALAAGLLAAVLVAWLGLRRAPGPAGASAT